MTIYSFDANSLITPWRVYYPIISFPALWGCFDELISMGRLKCAEPVFDEVKKGGDELSEWIEKRKDKVVYTWDEPIQVAVVNIQRQFASLVDPNGPSGADPWVIALAKVVGGHVVTFEKKAGPGAKRVKIPNVCESLGISCLSVFDVIAREKWVFRLDTG